MKMARLLGGVSAGIAVLSVQSASAVLVAGGDGTQNTSAPPGITGWNNVARVNGSSGVYLGNGWMLTAAHVGAGTATFTDGQVIGASGGTSIRLKNPDDSLTDLVMYQLVSQPTGLQSLSIGTSSPAIGSTVYMMGYGRNREAAETKWDIDTSTDPDTWTEKTSNGPADAVGYKYGVGNTLRWGANTIDGVQAINAGWGLVYTLRTDFDDVAGEGQLAVNDSGGAMFLTDGTLVGILDARATFSGQPSESAVYGNLSYAADLSVYYEQIASVVPEPGIILSALAVGTIGLSLRRRKPMREIAIDV